MSSSARTAPVRIAVLANFAPRKLGSLEDWLLAAGRVMNAMLQMNKLDIGQLQRAYDGQ